MAAPFAWLLNDCPNQKLISYAKIFKRTLNNSSRFRNNVKDSPELSMAPSGRQTGLQSSLWHERKQEIEALPTVRERLLENIGAGNQLFYFNTLAFDNQPYLKEYQENVCKAVEEPELHDELPAILSGEQDKFNKLVKEELEKVIAHIHMTYKKRRDRPENELASEMVGSMLYNLFTRMLSISSQSHLRHSIDYEVDRNILSQTNWIRGEYFYKTRCTARVYPGGVRFGYRQNVALQLRGSDPLRPSPHTGERRGSSSDEDLVKLGPPAYHLSNPHRHGQLVQAYSLPHSPGFEFGAVNPYVHLSVITPPATPHIGLTPNITENHKGAGIVHSFATLHAVAHYLGFDMFHDITFPLRTRTVATDGRLFSVTNFQLNTIQLLSTNHRRYNLYKTSELLPLYDDVDANGKVYGVSPEVLKSLTSLLTPTLLEEVPPNPYMGEVCSTPTGRTDPLLPYLPRYVRMMDLPELDDGSVSISTFKRYTDASAEPREWDLPRTVRLRRKEEKAHTFKYNLGPVGERNSPVSRGKTDLTLKLKEMRNAERKHRDEYRGKLDALDRAEQQSETNTSRGAS